MCGLCGYAGLPELRDPGLIKTMTGRIVHRGPDDEGFYSDEILSLGHRRLSIIDLSSGGHQPMVSSDGRHVVAYNGEIYNYRELRSELESRGRQFKGHSDTEVLLYWLSEFGLSRILDLNGMFAVAWWDRSTQELVLLRDRLGIKPLYYSEQGKGLVFGSEVKAMLPAMPRVEADHSCIYEFLTFQNTFGPETFFKGVKKLQPGHWVKWSRINGTQVQRYWDLEFGDASQDLTFAEATERYRHTMETSVRRHMISDVPVGAYLSGGIDSASVATWAAKLASGKLHTFTGAFTDAPYYDERIGSRAVAKASGAEIHEVEITAQDFHRNIGRVLYHLDEPTLGTGALPGFMVSQLVSKSVKVVLTGHGGDEMYAGYQVNNVALIRETMSQPWRLPGVMLGIKKDEWTRVLYYLLYPLLYPEVRHGLFIMIPGKKRTTQLDPAFLAQVSGHEPFSKLDGLVRKGETAGQSLFRLYLQTYLPTLFIQEDKVGMAHSIEARTPICDNAMLELATKLSLKTKMHGGQLKAVPRAAMRGHMPEILYTLPKRGFPTPLARWFAEEPLKGFIHDLVLGQKAKQRGILNHSGMQAVFDAATGPGGKDHLYAYARANLLYSAAMLELWHRTFVDQAEAAPVGS